MRRTTKLLIIAVVAVLVGALGLVLLTPREFLPTSTTTEPTLTENTSYPWSHNFTISISYNGAWKLTYQGYDGFGVSTPNNVSGSYSGNGSYTSIITLYARGLTEKTLCATAEKLDSSSETLVLSVDNVSGPATYVSSNSSSSTIHTIPFAYACETVAG